MTIKITKQLATMEDLAIGTGTVVQERNGVPLTLTKIDFVPKSEVVIRVTSISEIEAYSVPVGYVFSLNADGRSGTFDVVAGDFSAEIGDDTLNGIYVGLADDPTSASKVAVRRDISKVNASWFGAVGDGIQNDTSAVYAALSYVFKNNLILDLNVPVYITEIIIPSGQGAVKCNGNGSFRPFQTADQSDIFESQLLEFGAGVSDSTFDLIFEMLGFSKSAVRIRGDNNVITNFFCRDIQGASGRTRNIWGLAISGNDNTTITARTLDCNNEITYYVSGCFTATVDDFAKRNKFGYLEALGGAGAYLGNGEYTDIDFCNVYDATDNGIYAISGSVGLKVGSIFLNNCSDECVVLSGDRNTYIGNITATNCGRGLGVQSSTSAVIGAINWHVDDISANSGSPFFLRPGNVVTNSVIIEALNISGTWYSGAPICTLDVGQLATLKIGKINADLKYADPTLAATKNLGFLSADIGKISFGNINIKVNDTTGLLTNETFRISLPATLVNNSDVGLVTLSTANDAGVESNLFIRLINVDSSFLEFAGTPQIRNDLSPPSIPQKTAQSTRIFGSGISPIAGTWVRGDIFFNQSPTAGGYAGWICVEAGAPGVWKTFGLISS